MNIQPVDATSAASIGKTLEHIGQQMQAQAHDYATRIGEARGSMNAVAKILTERADAMARTAEGLRYDEPHGLRHSLEVHVRLLRDLALELEKPGSTKYAPTG